MNDQRFAIDLLSRALELAVIHDQKYDIRYGLVLEAVALANIVGFKAGFRIDPDTPDWPVACIDLPGYGQISWHMPAYDKPWDGHSTEEKIKRIAGFVSANRLKPVCYGCGESIGYLSTVGATVVVGDQEFCSETCYEKNHHSTGSE